MTILSFPRLVSRLRVSITLLSTVSLAVLLVNGCSSTHTNPNGPSPTVSVSASPASILAGASSTLSVSATNAKGVTISGSDGSSYTMAGAGGTQAVKPAATTTYTATATGSGGTATATATVTVTAATPAPTVTITAAPATITAGGSSTLTVAATNATTVTIAGSDNSSYSLAANGGTQAVTPSATTTYTATATGAGGTVTATATVTVTTTAPAPTVTITANPPTIIAGSSSTLTVAAANATGVTIAGSDGSSYTLATTGGTQSVSPAATTTYTATATGTGPNATATTTVTVNPPGSIKSINHVVFMLQENHTFDNYFGMLNPYRKANSMNVGDDGVDYEVDGIDDKLTTISNQDNAGNPYSPFLLKSTCIQDNSSDWLASFGDVDRYNFSTTRPVLMDGFVHNSIGYANSCTGANCASEYPDTSGRSVMGYYDDTYLNYYYYMASQFSISDRWFSPVASKSVPNRIATFTGGTTQGLVRDPGGDDKLPQLAIPSVFSELSTANVSWKIYYTVTQGYCKDPEDCPSTASAQYPATDFSFLQDSFKYLYENTSQAACVAPTVASGTAVGDPTNSFCIDPTHIAPLSQYFTDLNNGTLPSFAFIEAGYGTNDEHPGAANSVLFGQAEVANIVDSLMKSASWSDSVFFLAYDEGGGPYDHVPPVPGSSNKFTDASLGAIPDISSIAVSADSYGPCAAPTTGPTVHCDVPATQPGTTPTDAAAVQGFAAQLGFRVPDIVISPFARKHYVSHIPMDHTAIIKFVENRFIGSSAHLTNRDAAQPNLLDFFDFNNKPWATPPSPPAPKTTPTSTYDPLCTPANL